MPPIVTDSKELVIISLTKFFANKQKLEIFLEHVGSSTTTIDKKKKKKKNSPDPTPLTKGSPREMTTTPTEPTSLRIIDWFVTNYSKKHSIVLSTPDSTHFNVYTNYRSQLKAYSKHQFDPFRRRFRINYYYDKDAYVETTIGQLNFFKWLIEHDVLAYIQAHQAEIEKDMLDHQKALAAGGGEKEDDDRGRGREDDGGGGQAAAAAHQRMNVVDGNMTLTFV